MNSMQGYVIKCMAQKNKVGVKRDKMLPVFSCSGLDLFSHQYPSAIVITYLLLQQVVSYRPLASRDVKNQNRGIMAIPECQTPWGFIRFAHRIIFHQKQIKLSAEVLLSVYDLFTVGILNRPSNAWSGRLYIYRKPTKPLDRTISCI